MSLMLPQILPIHPLAIKIHREPSFPTTAY